MVDAQAINTSIIGRLLEEVSWEGSRVSLYRGGGCGMEHVLTAEVLLSLSFLPRTHFLGAVLTSALGARDALRGVAAQIEESELSVLPPELILQPSGAVVQPDALLGTASGYVLLEATCIPSHPSQLEQLAREYLAVVREAGKRAPVLLLILGSPPLAGGRGPGFWDIAEAISGCLPLVLADTGSGERLDALVTGIPEAVGWITWAEIDAVVARQLSSMTIDDPSLRATVERLATAVSTAIAIHS